MSGMGSGMSSGGHSSSSGAGGVAGGVGVGGVGGLDVKPVRTKPRTSAGKQDKRLSVWVNTRFLVNRYVVYRSICLFIIYIDLCVVFCKTLIE